MDAAKTNPDIPDVGGKLWSRDTNPAAAGSAWTVDLDRAGSVDVARQNRRWTVGSLRLRRLIRQPHATV